MAADGSVVIEILGDDKDINSKLKGVADGAVNGLKTAFGAVTASVTAASTAVGVFAKQSLDAYGNYEQLAGGVETLFKDSADTVMQYAENAYNTAGMSANEYMESATAFSASLISSLGGDTEAAAEYANRAMVSMSDNANKMGTNIDSIVQTYQSLARGNFAMLDNLKLGYGGTKSELERLIADAASYTDVQKEMGIAVDASSMSFDNIVNAIAVVQGKLGIAGATSAEAATTIEGSLNSTKAAWSNLVAGLGNESANLDVLIGNFVSSADTAAANIIPRITQILSGMGQAVQQIAPILSEQVPALVTSVLPSLVSAGAQLLTGLITGIITALPELAAAAPQIVNSVVTAISDNLPAILEAGKQLLDMLTNGILEGIPAMLEATPDVITALFDFLAENAPKFIESGFDFIEKLATGILNAIPKMVAKLPAVITGIVNFITNNLPVIVQKGVDLTLSLLNGILNAIPELVAALPSIIEAIVNGLGSLSGSIVEAGKDIIRGLWQGISDMAGWIAGKIKGFCGNALGEILSCFGINSPSRVMRDEVGKMLGAGLAEGIEDSTKTAVKSANAMSKDVEAALNGNALAGLDISGISNQLKSAVEAESARLSAHLTVSSNAPAEARAARDTRFAAQTAAASNAYTNSADSGIFVLNIDGKEFYRGTLASLRTVEDETPRTLDDV